LGRLPGRRIGAFIFDLDGTLIDSGLDIALSANHARSALGMAELPIDTVKSYIGDGVVVLMERVLGHDPESGTPGLPVPAELHDEGLHAFRGHYGRHLLDHTELFPSALTVLNSIRDVPLYLATNKPRKFTDQLMVGLGLAGMFQREVCGDEAPARKPDPSHLRACLEGSDVLAEKVVVVGDSPNDVMAARAMGAVSVGCTFGLVDEADVRQAGPDHLIDHLAGLLDIFPTDPPIDQEIP